MVDNRGKLSGLPAWSATATSILNGCIGDYLTDRDNGLAIEMAFYGRGEPLTLTSDSLHAEWGVPTRKLGVLLHGLCCHGGEWNYPGDPARSYGSALRETLDTPLFFCATTPACRFRTTASRLTCCSRNCCSPVRSRSTRSSWSATAWAD